MNVKETISHKLSQGKRLLAVLIDPDKHAEGKGINLQEVNKYADIVLLGGSLVFNTIDSLVNELRPICNKPLIQFPGNAQQLYTGVDAIFFLSLISGRNPEFLIGNHVIAAPFIKKNALETIPVGYILIDGGKPTTVEYISNTRPIPGNKPDIAVATALAGEMIGQKMIYLEAGSGAKEPVSAEVIAKVKKAINIPLIVGGGLKSKEKVAEVLEAGADIIVVGTLFEDQPLMLSQIADTIHNYQV